MELKTLMQNLSRNTQMPVRNSMQNQNIEKSEAVKLALEMFTDGEIVKGEVIDVNNLTAKILTQNGDEINGKLQSHGQLNIGEERQFIVKQDENGNTSFSIVKEDPEVLANNNISKALKDLGLSSDDKTLGLAKELINNKLPVNKDTIQTLNRGLALLSGDEKGLEKALLLLKNEIPVNSKNTNLLNNFISKEMKLLDNMNNIEASVNKLEDSQLKENIVKILNGTTVDSGEANSKAESTTNTNTTNMANDRIAKEEVVADKAKVEKQVDEAKVNGDTDKLANKELTEKENVIKNDNKLIYSDKEVLGKEAGVKENLESGSKLNLKFSPKDLNLKDLEEFLNTTKEKIELALKELDNSKTLGSKELTEQLTVVKDSMEFTSQLKNNLFLQLPLTIDNHETNGELLVFNNKNGGKNKNKKITSVIVGLDTANLGRFETYIKKEEKAIDLQFRLEDDRIINLVKANMDKLEALLSDKEMSINSIQFKKIENPFTLMSKDEDEEEEISNVNSLKFNIKM